MASKSTIECPHFVRKLEALYEASAGRDDRDARLTNDAKTAKRCGIEPSTVSAWRTGRPDKNREPGNLQEAHIQCLADEFSALTHGRVRADEGFSLWTKSAYSEFRRHLHAAPEQSLFSVLRDKRATLDAHLYAQGAGLGMISEALSAVEGEHVVDLGDRLSIEVDAKKGRSLVVIGTGPAGLFLLSPSEAHDGRIISVPEVIPREAFWTFEVKGPHTIHVIELAGASPPIKRGRYDAIALSADQERLLVEELLDPDRSGSWRRGEITIFVYDPAFVLSDDIPEDE